MKSENRFIISAVCIIAIILAFTGGVAALLKIYCSPKLFMALIVPVVGFLKEIYTRVIGSLDGTLLAPVSAYTGEKYEARVKARERDLKNLDDISFYVLLIVTTAAAVMKALEGGE